MSLALSFSACRRLLLAVLFLTSGGSGWAITYPPLGSFLYGNSGVNQVGQNSFIAGPAGSLPYRFILPKNYNPAVKYPVILFLHGSGEAGTNNTSQLTAGNNSGNGVLALVSTANPDNQTTYPCFLVLPQCNDGWTGKGAKFQDIINTLNARYSIDLDRICLTGVSLGALASWGIVNAMPTTFASLVPQSGGDDEGVLNTMPKLPIWVFHAESDANVACGMSDTTVATLRNRGFPVIYTRYVLGDHAIWPTAYQHPQLLSWIFAQRRTQPVQGYPFLELNAASLGQSPLQMSGISGTSAGVAFTRIGWCNTLSGAVPTGTDGATNGTTFSSPSFTFTPNHVGYRLAIIRNSGGYGGNTAFRANIVGYVDAHTVTVDRSYAVSSPRNFAIYKPGDSAQVNPSAGTVSAGWDSWSVSVPLNAGASTSQVIAEMGSGYPAWGGSTTLNQALTLTYAAPSGDTLAPGLALTGPPSLPFTSIVNQITLTGTASDNIAVTSVTWKTDRGNTGTATGTGSWTASAVPLAVGPNLISVTAKDAKNNFATMTFTLRYDPTAGGLALWKTAKFGAGAADPTIAGDLIDGDHDGIGNLAEYSLSGDPNVADRGILPTLLPPQNALKLTFTRRSPTDVTYIVEASSDLASWAPICTMTPNETWTGAAIVTETGSGATRHVTVQDTAPFPAEMGRYLRLKIVGPP